MSQQHTTRKSIARPGALTFALGLGAVGLGSPASAEAPAEFSITNTFVDVNPCTGEDHEVTINLDIREHLHPNGNIVARATRTGTTSSGYVMDHGQDNFVFNGNVARGTLNDVWRSADGSMFQAQGVFVAKEDGVVVDRFRLRCITD